ncbi:hypothetical protein BS47DRAFT_1402703 [Hydnum rufescens UP504]|uniref:Uncharacterized protein n=1 Tax=Hydnum rufescens UP504 TaxID=1448309 RepID=A0A9P6ACD9_9AGAM|nr:hypothetical protein BS47DRAFT_1402703 [Hydnum rufescens UP504]
MSVPVGTNGDTSVTWIFQEKLIDAFKVRRMIIRMIYSASGPTKYSIPYGSTITATISPNTDGGASPGFNPAAIPEPHLLGLLFHQHILTFPGIDLAPQSTGPSESNLGIYFSRRVDVAARNDLARREMYESSLLGAWAQCGGIEFLGTVDFGLGALVAFELLRSMDPSKMIATLLSPIASPFGTQSLLQHLLSSMLGSRASRYRKECNIVGSQIVEGAGTEQGRQWCGGINEYVFKTSVDEREAMRARLRNLASHVDVDVDVDETIQFALGVLGEETREGTTSDSSSIERDDSGANIVSSLTAAQDMLRDHYSWGVRPIFPSLHAAVTGANSEAVCSTGSLPQEPGPTKLRKLVAPFLQSIESQLSKAHDISEERIRMVQPIVEANSANLSAAPIRRRTIG